MTLTVILQTLPRFYSASLWLAVDKVIHHHDVLVLIIIRPRRRVAGCDPHPRDKRVVKHDAEEGKTRIARRSRDETAE